MSLIHAPDLKAGHLPWFNVKKPLDLPGLRGNLVILDFWTYCCINCIHVIPTLKKIEERFADSLVVIGVHSPKFPGEKETGNLRQAIQRYEITHPVVQDVDFTLWKNYAVQAWPTLVFIGADGYILGSLPGEPDPEMLEELLCQLLEDYENKGVLERGAASLLKAADPPAVTSLRFPGKIAYSPGDEEFAVADANHNRILTAGRDGNITRVIGSGAMGSRDGGFASAEFNRPQGLCFHQGILYVADTENHLLRKIDLGREQVVTLAGTGAQGLFLKGEGKARAVALSSPWDVALDGDRLYFANAGTHQIGVLRLGENTAAQFAGTGAEGIADGPRLQGSFAQTSGLSIGGGRLFLADSETSAVRAIGLDEEGSIHTYVGTGLFDFGDREGVGIEAQLQHPLGVHYTEGAVFIADSYNHKIKVLDLNTHQVMTVDASVDIACGEDRCSRLWEPAGVLELDNCLYVSDTNNHRILKIHLDSGESEIFIQ